MKIKIPSHNPHQTEVDLINFFNNLESVELRSVANVEFLCYDDSLNLAEYKIVHLYRYLEPTLRELLHEEFKILDG